MSTLIKSSFYILFTAILFVLLIVLVAPAKSSALMGTSLPTKCGTIRGYNKITATNHLGQVIAITDKAAPYYASQYPGNRNECVKHIQRMMNAAYCTTGTKITVDGVYGTKTTTAIKKMQQYLSGYYIRINGAKIMVDGRVGPQTWSILTTQSINTRYNPCS